MVNVYAAFMGAAVPIHVFYRIGQNLQASANFGSFCQ